MRTDSVNGIIVRSARYPLAAEIMYYRVLKRLVNDIERFALDEIRRNGADLIREADEAYARNDAFIIPFARGFISKLADLIERIVTGATSSLLTALDEIQRIRDNVDGFHRKEWARQLREAYTQRLAVNILNNEPNLPPMLRAWEESNIELIKSVPRNIAEQLRLTFSDAFVNGTTLDDLTKIVQERANVGRARAQLIARDQVGKLNGQLSMMRQKRAGIDSYIWRTMGDERVRPKHRARNGKTYRWDSKEIKPGEEIRCRCNADPIFPDLNLKEIQ